MKQFGLLLVVLVVAGLALVAYLFGSQHDPNSFIVKTTASEQLVDRFALNDSCAMLLNNVYFPPSTLVEFFCDTTAKQVNVYGKLPNGTIRRAVMPAVFAQSESTSRYVKRYVTQMRRYLTAEHDPYFWLVEGGVYYGVGVGIIHEDVPVICGVFDRIWTPPFIVSREDSVTARGYNLPPHVLITSADSAKVQYRSASIAIPLWW